MWGNSALGVPVLSGGEGRPQAGIGRAVRPARTAGVAP